MLRSRLNTRTITRRIFTSSRWRAPQPYKPGNSHRRPPPQPTQIKPTDAPAIGIDPAPPVPLRERVKANWKGFLRAAWSTTVFCFSFGVVSHVIITHGFSISPTDGPSMLPTLEVNEWIITSKHHRRGRDVQVGDMVSYWHPEEGHKVVKRVLGMPGDFVLRDAPGSREEVMLQVPTGHFWVVGDNLAWSTDSRVYGPVPLALIRGKVVVKLFPWTWIENTLEFVDAETE